MSAAFGAHRPVGPICEAFFMNGDCAKGATCGYRHESAETRGRAEVAAQGSRSSSARPASLNPGDGARRARAQSPPELDARRRSARASSSRDGAGAPAVLYPDELQSLASVAVVEPGYKWVDVPRGNAVTVGAKIRVCPITGRVQARRRFEKVAFERYLAPGDEAETDTTAVLGALREQWQFWKLQLTQLMNVVDPSEAGNVEFLLRASLGKRNPRGAHEFGLALAGVYKQACMDYQVEAKVSESVDDLGGYESDDSLSSSVIEVFDPDTREMLRKARILFNLRSRSPQEAALEEAGLGHSGSRTSFSTAQAELPKEETKQLEVPEVVEESDNNEDGWGDFHRAGEERREGPERSDSRAGGPEEGRAARGDKGEEPNFSVLRPPRQPMQVPASRKRSVAVGAPGRAGDEERAAIASEREEYLAGALRGTRYEAARFGGRPGGARDPPARVRGSARAAEPAVEEEEGKQEEQVAAMRRELELERSRVATLQEQLQSVAFTGSEASSTVLSSKADRVVAGIGPTSSLVWVDGIKRSKRALWLRVYSLDLPQIVEGLYDAAAEGLDVRVMVDKAQATKTGTARAVERLKRGGIPVLTVDAPYFRFDKESGEYVPADKRGGGELFSPADVYHGHHHYKYMVVDAQEEVEDATLWTPRCGAAGVVMGSFNPTKFSVASGED